MSAILDDMTDLQVLQVLEEIAREHLKWDGSLTPETQLVETMELDSIRLLTLVMEVENRFQVCLEEDAGEGIETAQQLIQALRNAEDDPD